MPTPLTHAGQLVEAVRQALSGKQGLPALVAIDGRGGAGKSTLAAAVAPQLPHVAVVHVDDFALGWESGWDWLRFREQVLEPLLAGRSVRYQRFDWPSRQLAEWHEVPRDTEVLILEGVSATRLGTDVQWDVTVWVDAPPDARLRRGLERDGDAALPLWRKWMAQEDAWVASERPDERCDFTFDGTFGLDS